MPLPEPPPPETSITLTLRGDNLIIRGPCYNKELCVKILKMAIQCIGDGMPTQVDAGRGGQRLLLPVGSSLADMFVEGKKRV